MVPSIGRPEALGRCLESIEEQTYRDFEVILVEDEGPLAWCRNKGARKAKGDFIVFIDDDTVQDKAWLDSIVKRFDRADVVAGVSGPSIIATEFRRNRDIFRYKIIKRIYDVVFLGSRKSLPGHFTKSGAWTTGAADESCDYEGSVHFLEACNMAFRRKVFEDVGGFDEAYKGVGDWSEPDLCFRIRQKGWKLWFDQKVKLYHEPSRSGAFKKRKADAERRLENYFLFSSRWISPNWRHSLYKSFIRIYYAVKST